MTAGFAVAVIVIVGTLLFVLWPMSSHGGLRPHAVRRIHRG